MDVSPESTDSLEEHGEIKKRLFSSKTPETIVNAVKLPAHFKNHEMQVEQAREPPCILGENGMGDDRDCRSPSRTLEENISVEEQSRRDEQASIELARAMMAEEAMASYSAAYEVSMDYLRNHQTQFSREDLAALQAAMEEEHDAGDAGENPPDISGMSYDMMLRLGEQIGDVKSERWARVAQQKIDALHTVTFNPAVIDEKSTNDCDTKCLICQCHYDNGDVLRRLPCGHLFHAESCVDHWLLSKDYCPYCRTPLAEE